MAVITGTSAGEPLPGTAGNDTITGAEGADTITMLGGNDLALWSFGDGADTVEGGSGTDTARFNGFGVFGLIDVLASAGKVSVGGGVILNDVEYLELVGTGFASTVTVHDLSGTDAKKVTVSVAGTNDLVAAYASGASNTLAITNVGSTINIAGLPTLFSVIGTDPSDRIELHGAAGNDKLDGSKLGAGQILLSLYGDQGNDFITGSVNDDVLNGGTGNDTVTGGRGIDLVTLGAGNDLFLWAAGNSYGSIFGQDDVDTVRATGSSDSELLRLLPGGGTPLLQRFLSGDFAFLDLHEVERVEIRPLAGADTVVLDKMTGTGVAAVAIDLAATAGGQAPDMQTDSVEIGTAVATNDVTFIVTNAGGKILVSGLDTELSIVHAGKNDVLQLAGVAGNVDAGGLAAGKITLELLGSSANDTIRGSAGADRIFDSLGNDSVSAGAGNDFIDWTKSKGDDEIDAGAGNDIIDWTNGTGDVVIDGGTGFDRLLLNGNLSLTIGASAGFGIVHPVGLPSLARLDGIERIELGAGSFEIRDVAGTDIQQISVNLSDASGKAANGQADAVPITLTDGNDKIGATLKGSVVTVTGLAAQITVTHGDHADGLIVSGGGGNDLIDMGKLPATSLLANLRGGVGNDTLVGGLGVDLLFGQEDDDQVIGEEGGDLVDLGSGNDLFIWNNGDGNDTVSGGADFDTLRFTGAVGDEAIKIASAGAGQFDLTRNVGAVAFSGGLVERIEIATLGGADSVEIGNLALAGVAQVAVDLATTVGGKTADTKIDKVSIEGIGSSESIFLGFVAGKVVETGLPYEVSVDHAGKTDILIVHGGDGGDTIDASALPAGKISLQLFGDDGGDLIFGSAGGDVIEAGTGNDLTILGTGNDTYNWFEFDGNDVVTDQGGTDAVRLFGNSSEQTFDLANAGGKLLMSSAVDGGSVELDHVERVDILLAGGVDLVIVHDLAGSDVKLVSVDFGAPFSPAGDGQADTLTIESGGGNDAITASLAAGVVSIKGLPYQIAVSHAEAIDVIAIDGFGGNDTITASALAAKSGHLLLDGGIGNDKLSGGGGDDTILGADGDDTLNGGSGNDIITGGVGNDTITGGTGSDVMRYTSALDGHDVVIGFDGNPTGGQDVLDLDALFDSLGIATGSRSARVQITDKGATVEIAVDTDGNASFDLAVATLKTADAISVGQDVVVGLL